mmetsp:Transcript_77109/g.208205  ORF Transcript_77109/g.208205 Transcript_77109/m.208205 type:complete len:125 (-) Transcript_77109:193-567(-)
MAKHPESFRSVVDRCKFFKRIQGQGEFRKHTFDQFEKLVAVRVPPPPFLSGPYHTPFPSSPTLQNGKWSQRSLFARYPFRNGSVSRRWWHVGGEGGHVAIREGSLATVHGRSRPRRMLFLPKHT